MTSDQKDKGKMHVHFHKQQLQLIYATLCDLSIYTYAILMYKDIT